MSKKVEIKTGVELIADERKEQNLKHGYTGGHDVHNNRIRQLPTAASILCGIDTPLDFDEMTDAPIDWDEEKWQKMLNKPAKKRLIIAGALIAAEIDRLTNIGE